MCLDFCCRVSGLDFQFRRVNARFAAMTGYTSDELLERGFPDITHPDDVAHDVEQVRRVVGGEIAEYAREKRYVRKDGGIAWGDVVVRPVVGDDGRPLAFVAMVADVTERRRATEESARLLAIVEEERRRMTGLVESMADEVWFTTADGRFTLANPAAREAFGPDAGDGTPVAELAAELEVLRPDGTPRPVEEAPPLRALAGEVVRNLEEVVRIPATGELRHRLVTSTPVRDDDGTVTGCVSVVRDVTDLRLAEREAALERERAKRYLDIAEVMVVAIGTDRRVLFANRKACEVLEREEGQIVGRDWFDTTLPEDERGQVGETFAQLMADNLAPWEYVENRIVTGSGAEKLIAWHNTVLRDDDGGIVATLSSGEDITERRRTEVALRESEERYRTVVGASHEGIVLQARDGRVLAWNGAAEAVFGVAESEIVGESALGREWGAVHEDGSPWPPEDHPSMRAFASGEAQSDVLMGVVREGETRWIKVNAEPVAGPEGEPPPAVVISFADVTARRMYERLLVTPAEILGLITSAASAQDVVDGVVAALKDATGLDAVGLRLRDGDDYPFKGSLGYPDEFLALENALAARTPEGGLCREPDGSVSLECTCGLVISRGTDPADPLYTPGGSAWTNDALPLLDVPADADARLHPRNRCIHTGFRSLALVPLRVGDEVLGLLHLADRRTDRFTPESLRFFEGLAQSIAVALVHRQAQEALAAMEAMRDGAEAVARVCSWRWDLETGRTTTSPEAYRLYDIERGEFHGDFRRVAEARVPEEDRAPLLRTLEAIAASGSSQSATFRVVHRDGSVHQLRAEATAERDEEGRVVAVLGFT